jgi:ribose-phosphate pyrophosphokinase
MSGAAIQWMPDASHTGRQLAAILGVPANEIAVHRFPDGELRVTVGPAAPTTIVFGSLDQPNEKLIALLFAAEALRREGARRLVLVAPYLAYMRQDAAFHAGEAISQRIVGEMLARTFDRIVTVEAHLHRTATLQAVFPGIEADNLSAMPAVAAALRTGQLDPTTVLVGPDEESRSWVNDLAARLGLVYAVAKKTRRGDRSVDIAFTNPALFARRPVLLIDDIVSSGGTLIACAGALAACGAASIDAIVTHALFPPALMDEFKRGGISSIRSTNTVPHSTNAIALDEILVTALQREVVGALVPENRP